VLSRKNRKKEFDYGLICLQRKSEMKLEALDFSFLFFLFGEGFKQKED